MSVPNLRLPSDLEYARGLASVWHQTSQGLDRRLRKRSEEELYVLSGIPDHELEAELNRTEPPDWKTALRETAKLHAKICTLYKYGIEPEHLAERFGVAEHTITRILRDGTQ